ncbi:MAG TPA: ribose-5-phosphate isomerase RpiA [Thermoplasmata archaeon]|nr:ribose-5-phosphate isomerase RpiA [Thermoplasmata archaeon]
MEPLAIEKDLAARAAAKRVRSGMRVALGTGSTAAYAIRALAEKFGGRADIDTVATSSASESLARDLGLPVRALAEDDRFDLMIDGADEVTPQLALTKGGGGALFREKFLARLSNEVVIIVDHTKLVDRLATRAPIPVEVVPFARPIVARRLAAKRFGVRLRVDGSGRTVITQNGNEILDLRPPTPLEDPRQLESELRDEPGVVESGIFVGLAHRVYVGLPGDRVEEVTPSGRVKEP